MRRLVRDPRCTSRPRGRCRWLRRTVGVSPVAVTGFEGLHRSRKKRIEALLRRLIGLVNGKGWALGLFDVDGDLVDYDVSQSGIGGRLALSLLCKVPFPVTQGPVVLHAGSTAGRKRAVGDRRCDVRRNRPLFCVDRPTFYSLPSRLRENSPTNFSDLRTRSHSKSPMGRVTTANGRSRSRETAFTGSTCWIQDSTWSARGIPANRYRVTLPT